MAGGRPTDYNEAILDKTRDYLANYQTYGDVIPSVAGLAIYLQVSRGTIYNWAGQEDKKEFLDILDDVLSTQERVLINNGLNNTFNANITKLVLGKHGYKDSAELTGANGKDLFPDKEREDKANQSVASFLNGNTRNTTGK